MTLPNKRPDKYSTWSGGKPNAAATAPRTLPTNWAPPEEAAAAEDASKSSRDRKKRRTIETHAVNPGMSKDEQLQSLNRRFEKYRKKARRYREQLQETNKNSAKILEELKATNEKLAQEIKKNELLEEKLKSTKIITKKKKEKSFLNKREGGGSKGWRKELETNYFGGCTFSCYFLCGILHLLSSA